MASFAYNNVVHSHNPVLRNGLSLPAGPRLPRVPRAQFQMMDDTLIFTAMSHPSFSGAYYNTSLDSDGAIPLREEHRQERRSLFVDYNLLLGATGTPSSSAAVIPSVDDSRRPLGLSQHDISMLKKERFDGKSEEPCCVCLDEFCSGAVITTLSCSHRFHNLCIAKWLRKNRTCPVCRFRV